MNIPPYLTILKWIHDQEIRGYNITQETLVSVMSSEALANASASNLIDSLAYEHNTTAEQIVAMIHQWAARHAEVLDTMPIGLPAVHAAQPHVPPAPPPPETTPPSWTALAKQFGRLCIGVSVQGKRQLRGLGETLGGWVGEKGMRAAIVALEHAAHADKVHPPLITTRTGLLAILFDGEKNVPEWVREG